MPSSTGECILSIGDTLIGYISILFATQTCVVTIKSLQGLSQDGKIDQFSIYYFLLYNSFF